MAAILASVIFVFGYAFIVLESKLRVSKSAFALATGAMLWTLVALSDAELVSLEFTHVAFDIFNIVIFLLAAMTLVEILAHYRFFDVMRAHLLALKLSSHAQFLALGAIAFVLSAIIDNLTTTIVMVQVARKFFGGKNLLVAAVGIVIFANAGGAFSPIGDVTTIMLWLAGKFSALEVIGFGILPSLTLAAVAAVLLSRKMNDDSDAVQEPREPVAPFSRSERVVVSVVLASFMLPVLAKAIHLPPVIGLLFGVGVSWILIDLFKSVSGRQSHLSASIEHLIQKVDLSSLKFFIGILLAVSALSALGILATVSSAVYGEAPSSSTIVWGNIIVGMASAVVDNIPLTAIAIQMLEIESPQMWVLLALAVGTGGSLLVIGSSAGVVAMGMVKELTFERYFKIGFMPALLSFGACMAVWALQFMLLGD